MEAMILARKDTVIFPGFSFGLVYDIDENPNIINFRLHNHNDLYEIVLLLNGDCEFHVEGNIYRLRPHDIVFTRPFEMHKISCLSEKTYERIIIYIKRDYFTDKGCEKYLDFLENRGLGTSNLIASDMSDGSAEDCIKRLYKYESEHEYELMDSVLTELLFLLNRSKDTSKNFYTKNERIRNIIVYINNNLKEDLSLDSIAKKFYISKHYMCNVFKKCTGYTINNYITYKRILLATELHKTGQSLTAASLNAGFQSYSNFYRAYIKQNGKPPREADKYIV